VGEYDFLDRLTIWTEGLFVKGYLEVFISGGWRFFAVSGQIVDGELHLHYEDYGSVLHPWYFKFIRSNGAFSLGQQSFTGIWYGTHPTLDAIETGSFVATLVP
jgi:hypothetical protein